MKTLKLTDEQVSLILSALCIYVIECDKQAEILRKFISADNLDDQTLNQTLQLGQQACDLSTVVSTAEQHD